jgi:hypothetical protein
MLGATVIQIRRSEDELWSPPIYADFMREDWNGCLPLDLPGSERRLEMWSVVLEEGRRLVVFDSDGDEAGNVDDLISVGVATFDADEGRWVVCEWGGETCHFSDLDERSQELYRKFRPEVGHPPQ